MMHDSSFPGRFSVLWSVDGAFEGLIGLADELREYKPRLRALLSLSLAITAMVLLLFSMATGYGLLFFIYRLYYRFSELSTTLYEIGPILFFSIILLSLSVFLTLLTGQTRRFISVLHKRLDAVEGMWSDKGIGTEMDGGKQEVTEEAAMVNPFAASLQHISDASRSLPEVRRHVQFSMYLYATFGLVLLAGPIVYPLALWQRLSPTFPYSPDPHGLFLVADLALGVLCIFSTLAQLEISRFIDAFFQRYAIIDSIHFDSPPLVPDGGDALERLERYLLEHDARLRTMSGPTGVGVELSRDVELEGASGDRHSFDLAFEGEGRGYLLVVRTATGAVPTVEEVEGLSRAAADVASRGCGHHRSRPGNIRAILLCDWTRARDVLPEMGDDAVEAIYRNPIEMGPGLGGGPGVTHVQVIVDEGEMYTMVPFIPERSV